jgi:hypothetical protein
MLDKSKLNRAMLQMRFCKFANKFWLIFFVIFFASCQSKVSKQLFNTQITCPNGVSILVKFANAFEIRKAIEFSLFERKKYGSKERYTIIRLSDRRSFKIENLSPEEIARCSLRDFKISATKRDYEVYLPDL